MRKQIKKTGGSLGVIFNVEDRKSYDIELGDIVEFEPIVIKKNIQLKSTEV